MVNKKGFIKTLEAIVAIIILIVFLSVFINKKGDIVNKDDEKNIVVNSLLNEIQSNEYLRNCVLIQNYYCIDYYLNTSISNRYYYNFSICNLPGTCVLSSLPKTDVYVKSLVITYNLTKKTEPKIIRIYLWNRV